MKNIFFYSKSFLQEIFRKKIKRLNFSSNKNKILFSNASEKNFSKSFIFSLWFSWNRRRRSQTLIDDFFYNIFIIRNKSYYEFLTAAFGFTFPGTRIREILYVFIKRNLSYKRLVKMKETFCGLSDLFAARIYIIYNHNSRTLGFLWYEKTTLLANGSFQVSNCLVVKCTRKNSKLSLFFR